MIINDNNQRAGSCELPNHVPTLNLTPEQQIAIAKQYELEQAADKIGVSPAKLLAMRKYAAQLIKSDRKMKPSTLNRKIREKFNVKSK